MDPDTICAYRKVYDAVKQMQCDVHVIVIGKEMLKSCKASHQRYLVHVEEQKQKKASEMDEKTKQQQLEVAEFKKKLMRLEADSDRLLAEADRLCEEAEAKNKISLLSEANALRAKSKLKRKELEKTKEDAEAAEKKLKLMKC